MADKLKMAENDFPWAWIRDAFTIAVENNVRKWKYIRAILDNWNEAGGPDEWEQRPRDHREYVEDEFADFVE